MLFAQRLGSGSHGRGKNSAVPVKAPNWFACPKLITCVDGSQSVPDCDSTYPETTPLNGTSSRADAGLGAEINTAARHARRSPALLQRSATALNWMFRFFIRFPFLF